MGWDNPPVPWRDFERRLSWRSTDGKDAGEDSGAVADGFNGVDGRGEADALRPRPVTQLPVPGQREGIRDEPGQAWAELHCHSSYSFLDGASSPEDLVIQAARLGLEALAITDHDGMYGVPQFAQAADRLRRKTGTGIGTVFGAELSLGLPGGQGGVPDPEGQHLLVLARDAEGYGRLCQMISAAQLAGGEKGRPVYDLDALAQAHDGHWVILTGCRKGAVPAAPPRRGARRAGGARARRGCRGTPGADGHVRQRERGGGAHQPRPARG